MLTTIHKGKAFIGENIASFEKTFAEVESILEADVIDPNNITDEGLVIPEKNVPPSLRVRKFVSKPPRKHGNLISVIQEHFSHQEKVGSKVEEAILYIAQLKPKFLEYADYIVVIRKITQHEATVMFAFLMQIDFHIYRAC
mgnify:CR=1 FL=1